MSVIIVSASALPRLTYLGFLLIKFGWLKLCIAGRAWFKKKLL